MNSLAFAGLPGGSEMILILFVVMMLFGAKKLPELSRSLGKSLGEFKKGKEDLERELRRAEQDLRTASDVPVEEKKAAVEPAEKEADTNDSGRSGPSGKTTV